MVSIKVFDKPKENEVLLKLDQQDGYVNLIAVDGNGKTIDAGYILRIDPTGIYRYTGVKKELGFALTWDDKIVDKKYSG